MGLLDLPIAPQGISPRKFFSEWLPEQARHFEKLVESLVGEVIFALAVKVEGPEGGEWTCTLSKKGLEIASGLAPEAVVTIMMNEKNFVSVVTGERKMSMQPPSGGKVPKLEEVPKLLQNTIDVLRKVNGMFQFRIEDPQAGDFVVTVKFAGPLKNKPDTTVSVDRDDADAMAKGDLNPQTAFLSGKIRISGDMGLLMQMAPLMMQ